jgi:DinB superfamily
MDIQNIIAEIRDFLTTTFATVDTWFDKDAALRQYQPQNGGWCIDQILEHIALTNHFLLILIDKGTQKALANAAQCDLAEALRDYTFHRDQLTEVGLHQSFDWIRPAHMEPTGAKTPAEVRQQLHEQVQRCLACLDQLKHGEGVLHKTTMTVNDLGKIDVYEYVYFLAQHGQRHVTQMEKVEREYGMGVGG